VENAFFQRKSGNRLFMALITPNSTILAHWTGALQCRLRRSPLEAFLRSRRLEFATDGITRDADNLATASTYLVGAALSLYGQYGERLNPAQQLITARAICSASDGLARLIGEPSCWRVAALVGAGRLLSSQMGISAAAQLAASAVHDYSLALTGPGKNFGCDIGQSAAEAVQTNHKTKVASVVAKCLRYLCASSHALPHRSDQDASDNKLRSSIADTNSRWNEVEVPRGTPIFKLPR
jgi:hypothetical protein